MEIGWKFLGIPDHSLKYFVSVYPETERSFTNSVDSVCKLGPDLIDIVTGYMGAVFTDDVDKTVMSFLFTNPCCDARYELADAMHFLSSTHHQAYAEQKNLKYVLCPKCMNKRAPNFAIPAGPRQRGVFF